MNGQTRLERIYLAMLAAGNDHYTEAARKAIEAEKAFENALLRDGRPEYLSAPMPNSDPNLRVYYAHRPDPLPAPEERTHDWVVRSLEYTQSVLDELRSLGDPDKARAVTEPLIAWHNDGGYPCPISPSWSADTATGLYVYDPVGEKLFGFETNHDLTDPNSRPFMYAWLYREEGLLKLKAELEAEQAEGVTAEEL